MTPTLPTRIYLASRSPRRRELLNQIGVPFDTLLFRGSPREDDEVDETPLAGELPADYVVRLARAKAQHGERLLAARALIARPVLSADTTVALGSRILGKPADADEAMAMLRELSGTSHQVLTAVAVAWRGDILHALSESSVRFRTLSEQEIRRYVLTGEPMDKAGAYGIQGRAGQFVEHLAGSYSGVMGLPLFETARLVEATGLSLLP